MQNLDLYVFFVIMQIMMCYMGVWLGKILESDAKRERVYRRAEKLAREEGNNDLYEAIRLQRWEPLREEEITEEREESNEGSAGLTRGEFASILRSGREGGGVRRR